MLSEFTENLTYNTRYLFLINSIVWLSRGVLSYVVYRMPNQRLFRGKDCCTCEARVKESEARVSGLKQDKPPRRHYYR